MVPCFPSFILIGPVLCYLRIPQTVLQELYQSLFRKTFKWNNVFRGFDKSVSNLIKIHFFRYKRNNMAINGFAFPVRGTRIFKCSVLKLMNWKKRTSKLASKITQLDLTRFLLIGICKRNMEWCTRQTTKLFLYFLHHLNY